MQLCAHVPPRSPHVPHPRHTPTHTTNSSPPPPPLHFFPPSQRDKLALEAGQQVGLGWLAAGLPARVVSSPEAPAQPEPASSQAGAASASSGQATPAGTHEAEAGEQAQPAASAAPLEVAAPAAAASTACLGEHGAAASVLQAGGYLSSSGGSSSGQCASCGAGEQRPCCLVECTMGEGSTRSSEGVRAGPHGGAASWQGCNGPTTGGTDGESHTHSYEQGEGAGEKVPSCGLREGCSTSMGGGCSSIEDDSDMHCPLERDECPMPSPLRQPCAVGARGWLPGGFAWRPHGRGLAAAGLACAVAAFALPAALTWVGGRRGR
jgi:hypothetical protein